MQTLAQSVWDWKRLLGLLEIVRVSRGTDCPCMSLHLLATVGWRMLGQTDLCSDIL